MGVPSQMESSAASAMGMTSADWKMSLVMALMCSKPITDERWELHARPFVFPNDECQWVAPVSFNRF